VRALLLAATLIPALALAQAQTAVPRLLPYQGRLLRADGSPETGSPRLTFRIYDTASGGSARWSETQAVPLTNGFYAVFLGSVASFPEALFDGRDRWVGISVGDGPELTPRQQIASVAYAITATHALVAAEATRAGSANRAASAALADRATTAGHATTAERASQADSAARTSLADRATLAEEAALARRVEGPVNATTVTATDVSSGTVTAASVAATDVETENLVVNGRARFTGGTSGPGSFVMAGYVGADGTVLREVGDPFIVSRIQDGNGHYRVTAAGLSTTSIILVTLGDSLTR